jgi:hypothetical protein
MISLNTLRGMPIVFPEQVVVLNAPAHIHREADEYAPSSQTTFIRN